MEVGRLTNLYWFVCQAFASVSRNEIGFTPSLHNFYHYYRQRQRQRLGTDRTCFNCLSIGLLCESLIWSDAIFFTHWYILNVYVSGLGRSILRKFRRIDKVRWQCDVKLFPTNNRFFFLKKFFSISVSKRKIFTKKFHVYHRFRWPSIMFLYTSIKCIQFF